MQMVSTKSAPEADQADALDERPRLYLNDDVVEKLGLRGIPAPGTVFTLQARVVAERVTAEAEEADEASTEGAAPDVSMCLVITDMALQEGAMSAERAASILYGN